jgi:proteasome accessory factor B
VKRPRSKSAGKKTAARTTKAAPRRSGDDKLARWVDLLAALLRRNAPATFEDLAPDVPAYAMSDRESATIMRMFERDKDELRDAGIPIETVESRDGDTVSYRLRRRDFYLPYLDLVGAARTQRVKRWGYDGLVSLTLSPDDADLLASAARRAEQLGAPVAADARSVARKLAMDVPAVGAAKTPDVQIRNDDRSDEETLNQLADAIRRRKLIELRHIALAPADDHAKSGVRRVEGYGLFFLSGHWYLAGRDVDRDALRNFRVSRVSVKKVNASKPQSPDYEIPYAFDLRDHARARHAWELGDAQDNEVVVDIVRPTAEAMSAANLGAAVPGHPTRRSYRVRRPDVFARWLLSLAGDVKPVAPDSFVERWRKLAKATLAQYETQT